MTDAYHTQVIEKRRAEFEKYFQEMLLASVQYKRKYVTTLSRDVSPKFARELVDTLQRKSGYYCDVSYNHDSTYKVVCNFVPIHVKSQRPIDTTQ